MVNNLDISKIKQDLYGGLFFQLVFSLLKNNLKVTSMGSKKKKKNSTYKLEELALALESERKRSEEYLTKLKYLQADFENFRKKTDRQIEEVKKYCNESIIIDLLETVDELEKTIKITSSLDSKETLIEGLELILKKLRKTLEKEGVFSIESLGKPFDPLKHNAILRIEREDVEGVNVIEEVRKGYVMKEKVIRPSVVKVAVKPSTRVSNEEVV